MDVLENRTFDELVVGDSAEIARTVSERDIRLFAIMSGNVNPAHLDAEWAASADHGLVVAPGMWSAALISTVLGTVLPGPGTIYVGQSLRFLAPVDLGRTVTVRVTLRAKDHDAGTATFDCAVHLDDGTLAIEGEAVVRAPREKIRRSAIELPALRFAASAGRLGHVIELARALEPPRTAIVHPVDDNSLRGAVEAADARLLVPVLVGPEARIRAAAQEGGIDISAAELVDAPHSHAAAAMAVALAREGKVQALMKGALHTDELMSAVVAHDTGIRTDRRLSHVFVMDVPTYPRLLLITDAAINIQPTLEDKRDIVQNAIDLARALGIARPRVAILSAVETVYPKMPSTIDAAALCKMADRGQIVGGVLDGPLAFDNAISAEAAKAKGIVSPVAGQPDILVVPDIESGNMLAKQLSYLAEAESAGLVLGASVPIALTSRADGPLSRTVSAALASLVAHARAKGLEKPRT
jgi:phosphotransacetylase/acyl dehydratase